MWSNGLPSSVSDIFVGGVFSVRDAEECVSLHEDVEEGGGEHTALSYSDGGTEPVPHAVVKVDCAGGLVIEVLYHSDQVGVDVEMLHGDP